MATKGRTWQEIAAAKRASLAESIPQEWRVPPELLPPEDQLDVSSFPAESGWFTPEELEITSTPATTLLESVASKKWTSEKVARAFCKRASAAHQLTNCLSETLFPEAIATAQALDKYYKETGKTIGPLHGLPISLKDNFNVVGKDSTVGFISWVNDPAKYNSTLVEILKEAGAVLYVKTNVPTAMMIAETVNNVFGRTVNPYNRSLTSGGSSGGESALIAFGGSVLGVGTDIGGSLRIPAACTGIFTLRPSFGRFPTLRARSGLAGQEAVNSVNGPMAKSVDDMIVFAKNVVDMQPWLHDPKCLPIPWRPWELQKKLKIAIMWHDSMVLPTPPVHRALKETAEKLRKAGHDIVDWDPKMHSQAAKILGRMFLADGGKSIRKILEPYEEPFRPEMIAYSIATELGTYDMWQLHQERTELCKLYLDQWNAVGGLDAILCPTTPFASVANGKFKHVGYTGVFNILDYSAVSFPCGTTADKSVDTPHTEHDLMSDIDGEIQSDYDPEAVHGMPVNLQLVARRLEEEKVLAMTKMVLDAL
ncbi:fatty-acid amide hydrolase [Lineolata rhizophorae]|uniref:amidase n=1 Tax=Lineolata rhizophorae TaxID=578093 RepID=A0A6A6NUY2_9PEZI|nr:fatty-acid amide hydrolase [Lineolata rhizophorae]